MSAQGHQPAGQPSGGQFMTTTHAEPALTLGNPGGLVADDMEFDDAVEQSIALTRLQQLQNAGMTGRATGIKPIDGWGVSFTLENQDGTFAVTLNDDRASITRIIDGQPAPDSTWVANASVITDYRDPAVRAEQIRSAYNPAMLRARTARRWDERSGLRSGGNVKFGLPELRQDDSGRTVGALDITMDVEAGGPVTYTVLLPRGKDKIEAHHQGAPLTPRMTAALLQEATEEGGGPAGTDMIGNAIAVTLLEEGETW